MIYFLWCGMYKVLDEESKDLFFVRKLCLWGKGIKNSLYGVLIYKYLDLRSIRFSVLKL